MFDRTKIINTIHALHRKTQANGCTEYEELSAQSKARELIAAHVITEAELVGIRTASTDRLSDVFDKLQRGITSGQLRELAKRAEKRNVQHLKERIDRAWNDRDRDLYDRLTTEVVYRAGAMFINVYEQRYEREYGEKKYRWSGSSNRDAKIKQARKMLRSIKINDQAKARAVMDVWEISEAEL